MATKQQVQLFIKNLAELAQAERKKHEKWVLPSVCIAQAALETGWGTSSLMTKANAYFGIKAGKSWTGKVYSSKTKECYDGVNFTTETACFRAYDSVADSVADYFDLIIGSSRYAGAVNETDAEKAITAIKNGGYATDPNYIDSVMNIINIYNLTQYDTDVEKKKELKVDGKWGIDTTLLTQKVFGTTEDGEVWHQSEGCREYLENCLISAWKFDDTKDGSQLIRQIQTVLADLGYYKGKIDGLCGKQTVMAIQAFLNDQGFNCGDVDGYMGEKTVMAWQQYINSRL